MKKVIQKFIPKMTQKLVFGCVGYAAHFLSSLAPCACTMVARSRQKICAAALPNSQFLNHFRYIAFLLIFTASILSADCTYTYETESEVESCKKIYVLADQLAITPNGIFIKFDDHWHETNALFSDANGIFIRPLETNRRACEEGYQRCRNCHQCIREVYDICPLCNRPAKI